MLSWQDNIFDLFPGCFLSSIWFICWGSPQNSPFHLCLPSFWLSQRSLEGISPVCSTLPRDSGIFCTREVLSQPQPLLTQGLHTSHHGLGSAFQQCLGSQISSKPFPGIAAFPLGSLNPALLPNPTWLLGRVDGMCTSPSGVWRGAGDGGGHWDLSQHCRAVLERQWLYL